MEEDSLGEESVVKTRKPYTITKQRERWTEEDHNRFLEALKLYGRAWQRIEEHIGTKTAVQIRSHAQKFFTKLEKEAAMKGIPPGQTHDIDIPPPRPKRKPSGPYPRKTRVGSVSLTGDAMNHKSSKSVSIVGTSKQVLEQGSDAPQKKLAATITMKRKEASEDGSCSEVLNFFQEAPSASISSAKSSSNPNPCAYMEFMPKMKEIKATASDKSSASIEVNKDLNINSISYRDQEIEVLKGLHIDSQENLAHGEGADASKQNENVGSLLRDNMQGNQSNSKQIPMHFSGRSSAEGGQTTDSDGHNFTAMTGQVGGADENSEIFINPTVSAAPKLHNSSAIPCIHQPVPALPAFTQFHSNHDAYRSFLNISSTFSSLIVYTLLQNPAVHAAASLAASFWPSGEVDSSTNSTPETLAGGFPVGHMNPYPSLASIAAATVAAASAWWASQGLLPIFSPHIGFTFNPAPTTTNPTMATAQGPEGKTDGKEDAFQNLVDDHEVNPDQSVALNMQRPSPNSSSSEADASENSRSGERSHCTEVKASRISKSKPLAGTGPYDSDETKSKKKPDRSSCGSNTPSSSEVETDTILDRHEKVNDEAKQAYFGNPSAGETNSRRSRSSGSINEAWKEVSEEGRLAFQALFSREVLPQSFSPPQTEDETANKEAITLPVDLNKKACATTSLNHFHGFTKEMSNRCNDDTGKSSLTSEIGQGKLKSHRTGFKPYKRCSMEARENRTAAVEETGNKRIRLEGEAST